MRAEFMLRYKVTKQESNFIIFFKSQGEPLFCQSNVVRPPGTQHQCPGD